MNNRVMDDHLEERLIREDDERFEKIMAERLNPKLQSIALVVAWSFAYADPIPLDEKHPAWPKFFKLSEWLRKVIIKQLRLPEDTSWETVYRISGFLVEEEYPNEEEYRKAHAFGNSTIIKTPGTLRILDELEDLKFIHITHRL